MTSLSVIVKFTLPSAPVVVLNVLPPIVTTTGALGSSLSAVTTTLLGLPSALVSVSIWSALTLPTVGLITSPTSLEFTGSLSPPLSFAIAVTVSPGLSGLLPGVGTSQLPLLSTVVVAVLPSGNVTVTVVFFSGLSTLPVTLVSSLSIELIDGLCALVTSLFADGVDISTPVPLLLAVSSSTPPLTPSLPPISEAVFSGFIALVLALIFE